MKPVHVNDQSIQQYIFDINNCDTSIIEHIHSCNICRKTADNYKLLSEDLKEQEIPILDFNLEERILKKITIQITQKKRSKEYTFISATITIAIGIILIFLNAFMQEFKNLFDTSNILTYFILCTSIIITTLLSIDIVRSFNIKMNKIKFS